MFAREPLHVDTLDALRSAADVIAQGVERNRAERALRESEESYRRLVELSPDAVMVLSESQIKYINTVGVKLFGATRADHIIGKTIYDIVQPDFHGIVEERIKLTQEGKQAEFIEEKFLRLDGQVIDVEVGGVGVNYHGKPAMQAIIRDITERVRVWEERMRLQQRLLAAEEEERRRVSRELHDQMGQHLPALMLGLKTMENTDQNPQSPADLLPRLKNLATRIAHDVHALSRDLRPTTLDDFGLQVALENYVEEWSERHGIRADLHCWGLPAGRLAPHLEITLYRAAQDVLTNVVEHARARHASIVLKGTRAKISLLIEDDGQGFNVEEVMGKPLMHRRLGLIGMQERVMLVGGNLKIESSSEAGTTVIISVPIAGKNEAFHHG